MKNIALVIRPEGVSNSWHDGVSGMMPSLTGETRRQRRHRHHHHGEVPPLGEAWVSEWESRKMTKISYYYNSYTGKARFSGKNGQTLVVL